MTTFPSLWFTQFSKPVGELLIRCMILLLLLGETRAHNILIFGDSWAELARADILEGVCPGATVRNTGIGGTTAEYWATKDFDADLPTGFIPDYIWVSLGGNDYLGSDLIDCLEDPATVAGYLSTVINKLDAKFSSHGTKILLTGYEVIPTEVIKDENGQYCLTAPVWEELSSVYEYSYPSSTTVIPVEGLFGGSVEGGTWTQPDLSYWADEIHLNDEGYKKMFMHPPIYNFLGCDATGTVAPTSNSGGPCFSASAKVNVQGHGTLAMKDLQVGDQVMTKSGSFQPVYAMDHVDRNKPTNFIQIFTHGKMDPLEITSNHMLFVATAAKPVPASHVKVGDTVLGIHGPTKVTKLSHVQRNGFYNALTASGTIVVNDIVASTYGTPIATE
jgi:hypothetical protein